MLHVGILAGLFKYAGRIRRLLLGNVAEATSVLLRVLVVDEKLTVLAIPTGLIARHRHEVEDRRRLVEDRVHLLQRPIRRLRVEEVHSGEDHEITVTR